MKSKNLIKVQSTKNTTIDYGELWQTVIQEKYTELHTPLDGGITDIVTFCDKFLNMDFSGKPYFKLIMKIYYMNSIGNEKLVITDEDIELINQIDNYGKGNPWLLKKAERLRNGEIKDPFQFLVLVLGRRSGKAQPLDAKILTPVGWKNMGDIKVGDMVVAQDGTSTTVTAVYPQGKKDIYEVKFNDGSGTQCCNEHLWEVQSQIDRRAKKAYSVLPLKEIAKQLRVLKNSKNYSIPLVKPVQFDNNKHKPISPYIMGILLGKGCFKDLKIKFANLDPKILDCINVELPHNYIVPKQGNYYEITVKDKKYKDNFIKFLKEIKLCGDNVCEKFIPEIYKFSKICDRIALLQGLMDSNGNANKNGVTEFLTKSKQLAEDLQFLVRSLGGLSIIKSKNGDSKKRLSYRVFSRLPNSIQPFRFKREQEGLSRASKLIRYIDSVKFIGEKEAQCISIAHPLQLYVTDDFIVTHNTYLASVIIAYEIYKLLSMITCPRCKDRKRVKSGDPCPDCGEICLNCPQAYYGLDGNEPLRIFLAAVAQKQAIDPGLTFVKLRVTRSKFFDNKFLPEVETLFFQTEYDKILNKKWEKMGLPAQEKGSVFVRALAANSSSSHGTGTICLLLDEFALFNTAEGAKENDKKMLEAMLPQTITFLQKGDGRVIMISMPENEEGMFYRYYEESKEDDTMLMMQMPTWEFRHDYSKELCFRTWKAENEEGEGSFDKLYGGQFSAQGEEVYFSSEIIEIAFNNFGHCIRKEKRDNPHHKYYMHIDCAYNSDNYAYCIVHVEHRLNPFTQTIDMFFIEDDSYFWTPTKDGLFHYVGENQEKVDIYGVLRKIVDKAKMFRVECVSFDNMQSVESRSFFMTHGLKIRQLPFTGQNKAKYYGNFKHALSGRRVILCSDDAKLKDEMKGLRVYYNKRGENIEISKIGGRRRTDDKIDCLVGACFMTTQHSVRKYPNIMIVPSNDTIFNSQRGKSTPNEGLSLFQKKEYLQSYNGGQSR